LDIHCLPSKCKQVNFICIEESCIFIYISIIDYKPTNENTESSSEEEMVGDEDEDSDPKVFHYFYFL